MRRKPIIIIMALLALLTAYQVGAYAGNPIKIVVDGKELTPDVPAQIIDGRTMVPIRFVAEALGAEVSWDAATNSVIITTAGQPAPAPTQPTPAQPQKFTGQGNDYTEKFQLKSGLTYVNYKYTGESNFIAWLVDNNGNEKELIANEIGSCDGKKAFSVEQGTYLINVESEGSWTIEIKQ